MMDYRTLPKTAFVRNMWIILGVLALLLLIAGCGARTTLPERPTISAQSRLQRMRYTIQVGAFSNIDNAVRLTASLERQGLDAYHFLHSSGLYKVRFENFRTKETARSRALDLQRRGIIDAFYIVEPDAHAADARGGKSRLREEIVRTATRYIGVPYRWGGESPRTGFDCSGLTMVVYRLNGLDLPRSSRQQWRFGRRIDRSRLQKGDLVFFATSGGSSVSHVGIYTGANKFLHAPGRGRQIQAASLSSKYYRARYVGARSYL
jgi:hypothetical protein